MDQWRTITPNGTNIFNIDGFVQLFLCSLALVGNTCQVMKFAVSASTETIFLVEK